MSSLPIETRIENMKGWVPFMLYLKKRKDEKKVEKCTRCGGDFFEYENFGSWGCLQHFRLIDENGLYICCNWPKTSFGDYKSSGCMRADHTLDVDVRSFGSSDALEMPINCYIQLHLYYQKKKLELHKEIVIKRIVKENNEVTEESVYLIHRSDCALK